MLEHIDSIIGKTKDNDDIRILSKEIIREDTGPKFLDYVKYQYEIRNQNNILMGICEIDQTTRFDGTIYFDEGEVETEKYGYSRKGIISQVYCFMNQMIYEYFHTVLHSDCNSISHKMSLMWQQLVDQGKAEFLGYNNTGNTYFNNESAPTPIYRMLPPKVSN